MFLGNGWKTTSKKESASFEEDDFLTTAGFKPFGDITKGMVWEAYKDVRAQWGSRMASGSYIPPEVKAVCPYRRRMEESESLEFPR